MAVSGNYAYIGGYDTDLRVLDISDLTNLVEVGFYEIPVYAMAVAGNYAYVVGDMGRLGVLDISKPTHPVEVGFYETPGENARGVAASDGYIYVANGDGGLIILRFTGEDP
jgi:hypothetical protein